MAGLSQVERVAVAEHEVRGALPDRALTSPGVDGGSSRREANSASFACARAGYRYRAHRCSRDSARLAAASASENATIRDPRRRIHGHSFALDRTCRRASARSRRVLPRLSTALERRCFYLALPARWGSFKLGPPTHPWPTRAESTNISTNMRAIRPSGNHFAHSRVDPDDTGEQTTFRSGGWPVRWYSRVFAPADDRGRRTVATLILRVVRSATFRGSRHPDGRKLHGFATSAPITADLILAALLLMSSSAVFRRRGDIPVRRLRTLPRSLSGNVSTLGDRGKEQQLRLDLKSPITRETATETRFPGQVIAQYPFGG